MINFKDFAQWPPNNVGEDRVNMVILQSVLWNQWGLVYYNPPSGSWKGICIFREKYEYRQVGPKRGVARMKRPDIAFQDLRRGPDEPRFLLFESKRNRRGWDLNLPDLLRAYFEDPNEGVRRLPFDHRRRLVSPRPWEAVEEASRLWFSKVTPDYLFGFAYGPVEEKDLQDERTWTQSELKRLEEQDRSRGVNTTPIVMVAVAFETGSLKPKLASEYSQGFPGDARAHLESGFSSAVYQ